MKEANHAPVTLLAIDDEADVLARIAEVLHEAGYQCLCAQDEKSAREALRQCTPQVIISDVNLVGHSGSTVCEQLKQQAGLRDVPVIFLAAAQVPDVIRRSSASGGSYYLRKPFDSPVLLQIIEKVRAATPDRTPEPAPTTVPRPNVCDPPKSAGARASALRSGVLIAK